MITTPTDPSAADDQRLSGADIFWRVYEDSVDFFTVRFFLISRISFKICSLVLSVTVKLLHTQGAHVLDVNNRPVV